MTDTWVSRVPLSAAEQHVDFPRTNTHIIDQRVHLEDELQPPLRQLGVLAEHYQGLIPLVILQSIESRLRAGLDRTAVFGFREAQAEVRRLRDHNATRPRAYAVPDAGDAGRLAAQGLDGVRQLIHRRSREVAQAVATAVNDAASQPGLDRAARILAIAQAGRRAAHNSVLELVGETLNMGRTAGALAMPQPPEFAMRSEQLDKTTCDICSSLHGQIAQVGSAEYWDLLPPAGCLGGGRCRGVMIFGDGPVDLRVPLPEAA